MIRDPLEALDRALMYAFVSSRAWKPGEVVGHMNAEDREALSRLTSDMTRIQIPRMLGLGK